MMRSRKQRTSYVKKYMEASVKGQEDQLATLLKAKEELKELKKDLGNKLDYAVKDTVILDEESDKAKKKTDQALKLCDQAKAHAWVHLVVDDFKASTEFIELKRSLIRDGQK